MAQRNYLQAPGLLLCISSSVSSRFQCQGPSTNSSADHIHRASLEAALEHAQGDLKSSSWHSKAYSGSPLRGTARKLRGSAEKGDRDKYALHAAPFLIQSPKLGYGCEHITWHGERQYVGCDTSELYVWSRRFRVRVLTRIVGVKHDEVWVISLSDCSNCYCFDRLCLRILHGNFL